MPDRSSRRLRDRGDATTAARPPPSSSLPHPGQFFPHCQRPAPAKYANVHSTPLEEDDRTPLPSDAPALDIHRRLLRLAANLPHVAIFPYLVWPIDQIGIKQQRGRIQKKGDKSYCFTLASMMAWELGDRRLRMGIVRTPPPNHVAAAAQHHMWVLALYSRDDQGKDLIIFDDSAEDTLEVRPDVTLDDVLAGQRRVKRLLSTDHRIRIVRVVWGGRRGDVNITDSTVCLEASLRFMERFGEEVESNDGRITEAMLREWHLAEVGWR